MSQPRIDPRIIAALYGITCPPATSSVTPVIHDVASEARNSGVRDFDRRRRRGLDKAEIAELDHVLARLVANVDGDHPAPAP
jgi:hypothetical protein